MSFTKGMNALNAAARNLDVIGNNVANANTVGFKAGQLYFAEVLSNTQSGKNLTGGTGAADMKVLAQFSQGNIESTNNPLDLAINGQGLFMVKDDSTSYYTRAGQFKLDDEGYIATPIGARLQGFAIADDGTPVTSVAADMKISNEPVPPEATSAATMRVNLDSRQTTGDPAAFRITDPLTYQHATTMPVYDAQGNEHALAVYFVKASDTQWDVFGAADGQQIGTGALGSLNFLANGTLDTASSPQPLSLTVPVDGSDPLAMTFDLTGTTMLGRDFAVSATGNNGKAAGQMTSYTVDPDGFVVGRYTNGSTKKLGQVALALFSNPQGLQPLGSNGFVPTAESGEPELVGADNSVAGAIQAGALEKSNVDLTQELVRMIEAQRVYQANAQAIKAQDAIMQATENLR